MNLEQFIERNNIRMTCDIATNNPNIDHDKWPAGTRSLLAFPLTIYLGADGLAASGQT